MVTGIKTQRQKNRRHKASGRQRRRSRHQRGERPTIRFTPFAWSKLLFLRDCGGTEVSGFGITAKNDLLLVEDVRLVAQECTATSVQFADSAVQELFGDSSHDHHRVSHSGCIWIHTHPGDCALPSEADEDTFARCCSTFPWAVMFIIAASGETYARLQFNVGPRCSRRLPVEVDYTGEIRPSDFAAWKAEYATHVEPIDPLQTSTDRHGRFRRSRDTDFHSLDLHGVDFHSPSQDSHIRAAITSEWLAHCDAVPLFEDDVVC